MHKITCPFTKEEGNFKMRQNKHFISNAGVMYSVMPDVMLDVITDIMFVSNHVDCHVD